MLGRVWASKVDGGQTDLCQKANCIAHQGEIETSGVVEWCLQDGMTKKAG